MFDYDIPRFRAPSAYEDDHQNGCHYDYSTDTWVSDDDDKYFYDDEEDDDYEYCDDEEEG